MVLLQVKELKSYMKTDTITIPIKRPRNPLVPLTKTRGGAGKHINRKKEQKGKHHEYF